MTKTTLTIATLSALALSLPLGCTVHHPPGYEELAEQPPSYVRATPFVMYGVAPHSYDLPDGDQVLVDVEKFHRAAGMGLYRSELAFSVQFAQEDDAGIDLHCSTDPRGPDVPETRFGCWSTKSKEKMTFWLAPDKGCVAKDRNAIDVLGRAECWGGLLTVGSRHYRMSYAQLGSDAPVARITWLDGSGRAVQAVNSVAEMSLQMYHGQGSSAHAKDGDLLLLHAIAMHYWYHATT